MKKFFCLITLSIFLSGCNEPSAPKFELKDKQIGMEFLNDLIYTEEFNPYTYRNFYNGAGIAIGDINNDGLVDVYFTGNIVDNKLFLNKGNWKFEEITNTAGVACANVWSTGATFADVNGDGFLDLYVCKSGKPGGSNRNNELFINNGDLTFKEQSKEYGLDVTGLSVHAAFFDFDKDGDLDCYVLNNSIRSVGGYDLIEGQREIVDANNNGNKFFENRDNKFYDVTTGVGMYSSSIGFGLGITISDFNNDSWPDLFISNDFFEKDYLYLNTTEGGFDELSDTYFESLSMGSMGADAADLDNDLLPDLLVTEMLPSTLERKKTKAKYDSWDKYALTQKRGYSQQFPRNMLQRNMGKNGFFEIGRKSGVAATEWSWASLIFDIDNDGLKDIFISNGINKDLLDRDYLAYMANEEQVRLLIQKQEGVIKKLIDIMPSEAVPNFAYKNKGSFDFEESTQTWGLDQPSFSNGNAYADLDNDGDLDLLVNNVNMPSFIYENKTDTLSQRSLTFDFKGVENNKFGVGAKILLYYNKNKRAMAEQFPSRGFQSSVSNRLHFGTGSTQVIDSAIVFWPSNKKQILYNLKTNKHYSLYEQDAVTSSQTSVVLDEVMVTSSKNPFNFKHKENNFIEFNRERLLPEMHHNEGPSVSVADINKDGQDDVFIGGGKNQSAVLFISSAKGGYDEITSPFEKDESSEDVVSLFFDGDQDGDLDLFVASGGKVFSKFSSLLDDRYYINDGNGNFTKTTQSFNFPKHISTGALAAADFNGDGKIDIFVGERFHPDTYGLKGSGFLMMNLGGNRFEYQKNDALNDIGMITGAQAIDINNDQQIDLVLSGEWMPLTILLNDGGVFENATKEYGLKATSGLWNTLLVDDFNSDGILDIIAGNIGENTFYEKGYRMYLNDFDQNGSREQIITSLKDGKYYPIIDKDELIGQLPYLKKQMVYYKDYASKSMDQIFDQKTLKESQFFDIDILQTSLFLGTKIGFESIELPAEIQYSSVYAIALLNDQKTSKKSLYLGGNQYLVKPQFGRYDASKGWRLDFDNDAGEMLFKIPKPLGVKGQIRAIEQIDFQNKKHLLISINDDDVKFKKVK